MKRLAWLILALLTLSVTPISCQPAAVKVGSKKFTESVILGEMITQIADSSGVSAQHYQELGGTRVAFNALVSGEIDAYPEYTGTITQELFAGKNLASGESIASELRNHGVSISAAIGFNNTYALGMLKRRAQELDVKLTSDLLQHPDLRLGFSNEFMDRGDGWPALAAHYGLESQNARGLDHDIAYRQLQAGSIDVIDVYLTDAKIRTMDLAVLEDDRSFFPRYDAVLLYRTDLKTRHPGFVEELLRLEHAIDENRMIALNHQSEVDRMPESQIAAEFLEVEFGIAPQIKEQSVAQQIGQYTVEHLDLVRKSLIPAILVGIPLGIFAAKRRVARPLILNSVGIIQTIPALALLVLLMPLVNSAGGQSIGVGSLTAVIALFLYSLLPIVRNTFTGLSGIEKQYSESAEAMGLSPGFQLWNIELPLATPSILAGIKTAAVMNVGFATLGALIGAGGYGQPILTGIRLADTGLILRGALPAAVMAIMVQMMFDIAERYLVPAGLRSATGHS